MKEQKVTRIGRGRGRRGRRARRRGRRRRERGRRKRKRKSVTVLWNRRRFSMNNSLIFCFKKSVPGSLVGNSREAGSKKERKQERNKDKQKKR